MQILRPLMLSDMSSKVSDRRRICCHNALNRETSDRVGSRLRTNSRVLPSDSSLSSKRKTKAFFRMTVIRLFYILRKYFVT